MAKVTRSNPRAFDTLNARLKELSGKEAKAGWFESAVYAKGMPVAYVASIQEFGSAPQGIPPRPFMRPTIARERNAWRVLMLSGVKAILAGNETIDTVMNAIGSQAAGDVAFTISQITEPKLADSTIAARLRKHKDKTVTPTLVKPLVDSAIMIGSVTHVVENS